MGYFFIEITRSDIDDETMLNPFPINEPDIIASIEEKVHVPKATIYLKEALLLLEYFIKVPSLKDNDFINKSMEQFFGEVQKMCSWALKGLEEVRNIGKGEKFDDMHSDAFLYFSRGDASINRTEEKIKTINKVFTAALSNENEIDEKEFEVVKDFINKI